jgi:phosphoribosylformylglycinamidine (FGAM) synthase-like enzyme/phosphoribosylformylglycinamidine (FGAM) synthase PurS component
MLWEVDIHPAEGQTDLTADQVAAAAAELGINRDLAVSSARGFLIQGDLSQAQIARLADELLADRVVERSVITQIGTSATAGLSSDADECATGPASAAQPSLAPGPSPLAPGPSPLAPYIIHILPKPGVMDPVAMSAQAAIADFGMKAEAVRTLKKYWIANLPENRLPLLCAKILANDAIEQVIVGPLDFDRLEVGSPYNFRLITVPIRSMDDDQLQRLSKEGQLFLSLAEMQTIREHFRSLGRNPTDVELETVAQTWSEHCSHKTLAGKIHYRDDKIERRFQNMLKETIFAATQTIRKNLGENDWCVSVFSDNAGVIRFDDQFNVVFKVETHNHPSALEPYGGSNTGIGGVIRDPMGTGMGAKPICNTDVFCFAPPDTPAESLPPGVLHPRRVMKGVVAGVRDYGNRMGIPTVNGAIYFDPRYLGNPLVYCGNIGIIPRQKSFKAPKPGDYIVAVGGRTGRDGIHGATFSSAELTSHSETLSGGAVQIGNAITEKMLLDVLLTARDRGLYNAVTDCGAGGFSSAVGEMGEKIGAEVWLERIPLKYEGLSYTEIWISEAQERMTLSVPPEKWDELLALCSFEGVEATTIGKFLPTGRLVLKFGDNQVADLAMEFLHKGQPPVVRDAIYTPPALSPLSLWERDRVRADFSADSPHPIPLPKGEGTHARATGPASAAHDFTNTLHKILGALNVCSKHWVIRQYDHEVQGGSVIKPLVGAANDGPSDAAVVRPLLTSHRGIVVSCGMNPLYGGFDTYWMAASAIDEAVRNCVAVGANPDRIAILDNFCWGNTDRPEILGSLVRAALACHDIAIELGTPFISGKDSLNNEFRPLSGKGNDSKHGDCPDFCEAKMGPSPFVGPISIPPSLLISALGQIDDVRHCITMDLKRPGNLLYQIGLTKNELGGSHFALVENFCGGEVPKVDAPTAKKTFAALHRAIYQGLVCSCHDLSEGGLAAAIAEMAFAGAYGAKIDLHALPSPFGRGAGGEGNKSLPSTFGRGAGGEGGIVEKAIILLFSESNTRFLCEVTPDKAPEFEKAMSGIPHAKIGEVIAEPTLEIAFDQPVIKANIAELKESWQKPLRW